MSANTQSVDRDEYVAHGVREGRRMAAVGKPYEGCEPASHSATENHPGAESGTDSMDSRQAPLQAD